MAKKLIDSTERYDINHHTGMTTFSGCQCFKDCTCHEDFIPRPYNYYSVKKKFNKIKTTTHNTIEEVQERIKLLNTITINH